MRQNDHTQDAPSAFASWARSVTTRHFGIVVSAIIAGYVLLRLLVVSRYDAGTALTLVRQVGYGNAIVAILLQSAPLVLAIAGLLLLAWILVQLPHYSAHQRVRDIVIIAVWAIIAWSAVRIEFVLGTAIAATMIVAASWRLPVRAEIPRTVLIALCLLTCCAAVAVSIFDSRMWLQQESVTVAVIDPESGDTTGRYTTVGYVLTDDSQWHITLVEDTRTVEFIDSEQVAARLPCETNDRGPIDWLTRSVSRRSNRAAVCPTTQLPSEFGVVGAAATDEDARRLWLITADGVLDPEGTAPTLPTPRLRGAERVTAIAADPIRLGYWVATDQGRVIAVGDTTAGGARWTDLSGPIVGLAPHPEGGGYWIVTAAGEVRGEGVQVVGDLAALQPPGQVGGLAPVVDIVADPDGEGYWIVLADGGVLSYDAPFLGSLPAIVPAEQLPGPIVAAAAYGNGYVLASSNGGAFNFSSSPFVGAAAGFTESIVVDIIGLPNGYLMITDDGMLLRCGEGPACGLATDEAEPAVPSTAASSTTGVTATDRSAVSDADCNPNYLPCISRFPPDLDCSDIGEEVEVVGADDPHQLDSNGDGLGCTSRTVPQS